MQGRTEPHRVHKLISIYVHCDLDLWPPKSKGVYPLTMANMSAKFDKERNNGLVSIMFTSLIPYVHCDLGLWPKINRVHPRTMVNMSAKIYKENLSRWWGVDRENPRDEPPSLDRAFARSRQEIHPEGFPYPHLINVIDYLSCLYHTAISCFRCSKHLTYLPRRVKTLWRHHSLCSYAFAD